MIFSGIFLPLAYIRRLQPITVLPFASMLSAPGVSFVNPGFLGKESILIQGAAVTVFMVMAGIVQFVAMRRLFSNGG
jgi:hypothetical protein